MPYSPGVTYDASPIFQGISNAGKTISNAYLERRRAQQQADEYAQNLLLQRSKLDQDQELRYADLAARASEGALDRDARAKLSTPIPINETEEPNIFIGGRPLPGRKKGLQLPGMGPGFYVPLTGQVQRQAAPGKPAAKYLKQPEYSPDGKFYRTEVNGPMKPLPRDPMSVLNQGGTGTPAPAGVRTVTNKEDYDKLPDGEVFVGADGKKYRK